jgi:hypothetical protein
MVLRDGWRRQRGVKRSRNRAGPLPLSSMRLENRLDKLLGQIADQEALVRRMVTQGSPTQAAEDRLRELQRELARVREVSAGASSKA